MRKLKFFIAVVLIGVFGLLTFENSALFGQWYAFNFNFFIYEYRAPKIMVGVYFIAVFLMGFLIAYFSGLMDQYRSRRIVRRLEKELAACKDRMPAYTSNQKADGSEKAPQNATTGASQPGPSA